MELDLRPVTDEEFPAYVTMLETAAGRHVTPDAMADATAAYQLDRTLAAFDRDGHIVGGTATDPIELTLPGSVAMASVRATLTGVLPTHRGAGLATRLLCQQLQDCAQRGDALVVAATSTPGLVRRAGYGAAAAATHVHVALPATAVLTAAEWSRFRLVQPHELVSTLPDVFERHRMRRPGQVSRSPAFWSMYLHDRELFRTAPGERFAVVFESGDGVVQGYLTYRLVHGDLRIQPIDTLLIEDLIDTTDEARRMLWRFALSFDQARWLDAPNVGPDEPAPWLLDDSRRLAPVASRDFLWLRIVDPVAALGARSYGCDGRLLVEIEDAVVTGNRGTFALESNGGTTRCERVSADPELRMDVADLAAAFLGRTSFARLALADRVIERTTGAITRADAMFRSTPEPWTVTDW